MSSHNKGSSDAFKNNVVPTADIAQTGNQKDAPLFGTKKIKIADESSLIVTDSSISSDKVDIPKINVAASGPCGLVDSDKDALPALQVSSSPVVRNLPDKRLSLSMNMASVIAKDGTSADVSGGGTNFNFSFTEGQTRRSHLADHEFACSMIIDHVYVSGRKVAAEKQLLDQYKIKYIVNCASSIIPNYFQESEENGKELEAGAGGEEDREMMIRGAESTNSNIPSNAKVDETSTAAQVQETLKSKNKHGASNFSTNVDSAIQYLSLNMVDGRDDDIAWFVAQVLHFIQIAVDNNANVLVHCEKGVSRSCSFVIAYLMWSKRKLLNLFLKFCGALSLLPLMYLFLFAHVDMKWKDAFQYVKTRRNICNPNTYFTCNLIELDELFNRNSVEYKKEKRRFSAGALNNSIVPIFTPSTNPTSLLNTLLVFRLAYHLEERDEVTPVLKLCRYKTNRKLVPLTDISLLDSNGIYVILPPHNINNVFLYIWVGKDSNREHLSIAEELCGHMVHVFCEAIEFTVIHQGEESVSMECLQWIDWQAKNSQTKNGPNACKEDFVYSDLYRSTETIASGDVNHVARDDAASAPGRVKINMSTLIPTLSPPSSTVDLNILSPVKDATSAGSPPKLLSRNVIMNFSGKEEETTAVSLPLVSGVPVPVASNGTGAIPMPTPTPPISRNSTVACLERGVENCGSKSQSDSGSPNKPAVNLHHGQGSKGRLLTPHCGSIPLLTPTVPSAPPTSASSARAYPNPSPPQNNSGRPNSHQRRLVRAAATPNEGENTPGNLNGETGTDFIPKFPSRPPSSVMSPAVGVGEPYGGISANSGGKVPPSFRHRRLLQSDGSKPKLGVGCDDVLAATTGAPTGNVTTTDTASVAAEPGVHGLSSGNNSASASCLHVEDGKSRPAGRPTLAVNFNSNNVSTKLFDMSDEDDNALAGWTENSRDGAVVNTNSLKNVVVPKLNIIKNSQNQNQELPALGPVPALPTPISKVPSVVVPTEATSTTDATPKLSLNLNLNSVLPRSANEDVPLISRMDHRTPPSMPLCPAKTGKPVLFQLIQESGKYVVEDVSMYDEDDLLDENVYILAYTNTSSEADEVRDDCMRYFIWVGEDCFLLPCRINDPEHECVDECLSEWFVEKHEGLFGPFGKHHLCGEISKRFEIER